jgi:predicted nucleic acid-binding protein
VIAVDTNLFVYAHREDADFHQAALDVLVELAGSGDRWAIPWPCVHEFLAVVTHPRIFLPPTPVDVALDAMAVWIASPTCRMIGEGPEYFTVLRTMVSRDLPSSHAS